MKIFITLMYFHVLIFDHLHVPTFHVYPSFSFFGFFSWAVKQGCQTSKRCFISWRFNHCISLKCLVQEKQPSISKSQNKVAGWDYLVPICSFIVKSYFPAIVWSRSTCWTIAALCCSCGLQLSQKSSEAKLFKL